MVNKLRIVSRNIVTSINSSSTAKSMNDYKSQYDTNSTFTATIETPIDTTKTYAIVFYLAENPGSLQVNISSGASSITTVSGNIAFSNYNNMAVTAGYGSGGYFVVYVQGSTISNRSSFTFTFNKFIKLSKLLIGPVWTPKYNANYGASVSYVDTTSVERLQGGDQLAVIGPRYKTIHFDLQYVDEVDKDYLLDLAKLVGKSSPIFISVFPEDTDYVKEQMYSIIGRLVTPPNISYTMYSMYSSSIDIEEL